MLRDWQELARSLANQLRRDRALTSDAWHAAVSETPRHKLVPTFYPMSDGHRGLGSDRVESDTRLDEVYAAETLVTAIEANEYGSIVPTSSSTKPDLMVRMLEDLDVADGQRVLEIGTGSGYNAALLSHRLGDKNVFSIDVAAGLVRLAENRLRVIGYEPSLAVRDGAEGWKERGPYDRIIATCAVRHVPRAWFEQLAPNGKLIVDFKPHGGNLVSLRRDGDNFEGMFLPYYGAFMVMRHNQNDGERSADGTWRAPIDESTTRHTAAPVDIPSVVGFIRAATFSTPLRKTTTFGEDREPTGVRLASPDGSWCEIANAPRADGLRDVREAGPTAIWAQVEDAFARWHAAQEPGWDRLGVTIDRDARTATWIDTPRQPLCQERGAAPIVSRSPLAGG